MAVQMCRPGELVGGVILRQVLGDRCPTFQGGGGNTFGEMMIRLIALSLVASLFSAVPSWAVDKGTVAPPSQEYVQWVEAAELGPCFTGATGRPLGDVPPRIDLSHLKGDQLPLFAAKGSLSSLPVSYDLRSTTYLPPVRDQGPFGTCWAFGSMGSMESTFLKRGGVSKDFSEAHLAYFAYVDIGPEMPAFTQGDPSFGNDPIFDQGGQVWKSTALLSRWTGAVNESDRPYQYLSPWPQELLPLSSDPVSSHLEQVLFLGSDFHGPSMKSAVMDYGAVAFSMVWSNDFYNVSTDSYYNPTGNGGGHAVLLVGWDDHYPRGNFKLDPGSDGAWLVKNSWGEGWGDKGFFWISYKEAVLRRPALFIGASSDNFEYIYQHDPLGWVDSYGFNSDTAWFANVFQVSGDVGGWQSLEAISLYTGGANSSYTIEVWSDGTPENPRSGRRIMTPQEGTIPMPGYHTVRLKEPPYLYDGSRFSVVVRLTTPGYLSPVPIESPEEGYSDKAKASNGQSYVSSDGATWLDMNATRPGTNVCIKAFTSKTDPPPSSGGGCTLGVNPGILLLALPIVTLIR